MVGKAKLGKEWKKEGARKERLRKREKLEYKKNGGKKE